MPLKDYSTKAAFDADYQTGRQAPNGQLGGNYERWWLATAHGDALQRIVEQLQLAPGASIFVVGCGFGWGVERLAALGFEAWGADTSAWIQAEKGATNPKDSQPNSTAPARILPHDVTTAQGRQRVRQDTGITTWDCIITDHLLEVLADAEAVSLSAWIHANYLGAGPLAHRVAVLSQGGSGNDPTFNWKTDLAAWRALLSGDFFFDGNGRA